MSEDYSESEEDMIVSYCMKCKQGLQHVILTMAGETVARVRCTVCGSAHKYRNPAGIKKPRIKKKEDALKTAEALWEISMAETKGKERVYDMSGKYRVGDIILHSAFGKGIVRKLYQNKCDVLFKDKERLMASTN